MSNCAHHRASCVRYTTDSPRKITHRRYRGNTTIPGIHKVPRTPTAATTVRVITELIKDSNQMTGGDASSKVEACESCSCSAAPRPNAGHVLLALCSSSSQAHMRGSKNAQSDRYHSTRSLFVLPWPILAAIHFRICPFAAHPCIHLLATALLEMVHQTVCGIRCMQSQTRGQERHCCLVEWLQK